MQHNKINHLASDIEKLSLAGQSLPSLSNQLNTLQQATNELKIIFKDALPADILAHCWVVDISATSMTLAVNSTTAANHINYLQQEFLQILTKQSNTFKYIQTLKVIVVNI